MSVTLPSEIIDLADEDEYNNLLIYGDSGVGKTVLAGSDEDVLFVAPEDNGTLSAKRFGSKARKWKIGEGAKGWDDIVKAYEWLYSLGDEIPFNWVVLDSLTEMQDMCMRKVLAEALEINPQRDPDLPLIGDWQPYYNRFQRLVKAYNALPVNILYTALQQEEENEDGEKVVLPMLQGKGTQYAKKVCGFMTSFGNIRVVRKANGKDEDGKTVWEEYRQIQWKASKLVMAKDRTRCLEPRTIIGDGKVDGLKGIRELLEAGPVQPAAGRIPPKGNGEKASQLVRQPKAEPKVAPPAVTIIEDDDDDDEDSEESQVNLMGVGN